MDRILVPLDGSTLAEAIVPVAEALAGDYESELILIRAVAPRMVSGVESLEAKAKGAEAYLARMGSQLRTRGLSKVRWSIRYARPDQAIAEAAVDNQVDLIAMTTHGRGGLARLLLGSVAESLVRLAPAPVLLVRGQPSWRPGGIGKILVPLDGSEMSAAILPVVERLAGPFDLSIILFHTVEPIPRSAIVSEASTAMEDMARIRRKDAEEYLSKVATGLDAKGLRVQHAVRIGQAGEVIEEYARQEGIGLIAMTTHGRSGFGRLFFGSVAEDVLRAATVPVLLRKAREE
ncbi:MAG: universal stress protein [Candidatus Methylomirabilia bacterium]